MDGDEGVGHILVGQVVRPAVTGDGWTDNSGLYVSYFHNSSAKVDRRFAAPRLAGTRFRVPAVRRARYGNAMHESRWSLVTAARPHRTPRRLSTDSGRQMGKG